MGQGEGQSIVAAAMATFGGGVVAGDKPRSFKEHGHDDGRGNGHGHGRHRAPSLEEQDEQEQQTESHRDTSDTMVDDERETLLELLSGAYGQVRYLRGRRERGEERGWAGGGG